jgi:predicted dithiol-disulfide oxidoreductase (DUF899 family)
MRNTRLANESPDYLARREELRLAEIDLMKQRERVADLRRRLPEGAMVKDYMFQEGPADLNAGDTPIRTVRLSELFSTPGRPLIVYHLMFGKAQTTACPMCSTSPPRGATTGTRSWLMLPVPWPRPGLKDRAQLPR